MKKEKHGNLLTKTASVLSSVSRLNSLIDSDNTAMLSRTSLRTPEERDPTDAVYVLKAYCTLRAVAILLRLNIGVLESENHYTNFPTRCSRQVYRPKISITNGYGSRVGSSLPRKYGARRPSFEPCSFGFMTLLSDELPPLIVQRKT